MELKDLRYEVDGHIGVITLNRPKAHNALRRRTYEELEQIVREADVRCLVITGEGKSFCAGDDVKELMSGETTGPITRELTPAADALIHTDTPVIAAVNGAAVGWGMELALFADIRVISEEARFGELFVLRGLCSDVAGIARLARLVGREVASELLFTGEVIDAGRAKEIGLVSRVTPHDDLMTEALTVARRIAENPPLAVRRLKAGLRRGLDPDWQRLGQWVSEALSELFETEDHREGVNAFLERRTPQFVGR